MAKQKYTIDIIRSEFEKEGYLLLTDEYKSVYQKLDYICPNGHKHSISWGDWKSGYRCKQCGYDKLADKYRYSFDFIKSEFEKEGYQLLTTEYKNSKQKLDYICTNGHKHSIVWESWRQGSRCKICGIELRASKLRMSLDFIKSEFEKEGYQLLTTEYKNAHCKLDYICPNGHRHSITWYGWKYGYRCPYCYGNIKYSMDFIRSEFEKEGYQLLTAEYKGAHEKLNYVCPNGHESFITWNKWNRGQRCQVCYHIRNSGPNNTSWKGGVSFEPYCPIWKDKEYKSDIKLRDGNQCLNPYCSHNDKKLVIHHIDYDKKNCAPHNLITVCRSCNARANIDREWHTSWYRKILSRRYNYKY